MRYWFVIFILSLQQVTAQTISGRIMDPYNQPVEFSPVALLTASDSVIFKGVMTDETGAYTFNNIPAGSYLLKVEIIGFQKFYSELIAVDSTSILRVPVIQLTKNKEVDLDEISVNTIKRTVEFKNGNIIVNVENSALAAGNTAYDLLMKLPGVALNEDGITIQGRAGVQVMINERVQRMSYRQLVNLLKSISSSSIEKIEVLKNPPLKYASEGTAGLINIKTKKVKLLGLSGSVNSSYSQGFFPQGESSFSLNYKTRKLVIFTDFSSEYGKYLSVNKFDRTVTFNSIVTKLNQRHTENELDKEFQTNVGLDFQIDRKNIIGCKLTVGPGWSNEYTGGNNLLSDTSLGYDVMNYSYSMSNIWNYMNYNINAEHHFDTLGTKLLFSADYSPNWDVYGGNFDHRFIYNNSEILSPRIIKTFLREDMTMLSAKLDLEAKLSETTALEAGVKGTQQQFIRDYTFENKDPLSGHFINDTSFSSKFRYTDQVLAAYANVEQELGDFELSAGVRAEKTIVDMNSPGKAFSNSKNYFNLFPAASAEFEASDKHTFELSFNKRINRPDFFSFYPYRIFWSNIMLTDRGNPDLVPEYSTTFELTHVYNQKVSNAIAYSRVKNYLLEYTIQNDSTKEMVGYLTNLSNNQTFGYTFFCENKIRNWWVVSGNLTFSYVYFRGQVNDLDFSSSGYSSNGLIRNELITGKRSKLEVSAQFIGRQPLGVFVIQPRWALYLAFKQKLFKDKLDLVVGIDDVFYTMVGRNQVNFQNQKWKVSETNDTRRFKISLNYNFGKVKIERRDVNSNEEEKEKLKH